MLGPAGEQDYMSLVASTRGSGPAPVSSDSRTSLLPLRLHVLTTTLRLAGWDAMSLGPQLPGVVEPLGRGYTLSA